MVQLSMMLVFGWTIHGSIEPDSLFHHSVLISLEQNKTKSVGDRRVAASSLVASRVNT